MNPIALSLIGSYRLRAAVLWLAHRPGWELIPLAVVGALVLLDIPAPGWVLWSAGLLTLALVPGAVLGARLHRELDEFGVPCRWCDTEYEIDEITEGDVL